MKIWVLQRAATGDWEEPSQNYYGDICTQDVAIKTSKLETDRTSTRAVPEVKIVCEPKVAWNESAHNWKSTTPILSPWWTGPCTMCAPPGCTRKVIAEVLPCS
jgi:hypothetical protein